MRLTSIQKVAAAVTLAVSASAHADLISFDPTGGGAINPITATFDWVPGSALAANVNTATGILAGTNFTTYYQANLGTTLNSANGTIFTNGGSGSQYFTAVAAFGETVNLCAGAPCSLAQFAFNATTPNFFKIFATNTLGIDASGAGFGTGTAILTAHVIGTGFSSNFGVSSFTPVQLDQSPENIDKWPGITTVQGSGGSKLQVQVDSVLAGYFPDLLAGSILTLGFFDTNQNTPFTHVDPSHCLYNGVVCGENSDVGTFNGAPISAGGGADVIFEADGSTSFVRTIPEPGSLALVGLALFGAAAVGRRRRST